MKFNKLIILILAIFLTLNIVQAKGFKLSVPLEGDSIANDTMQFNAVTDIYSKLIKLYPTCYDFSVENTQVMHFPYDVKKKNDKFIAGYWKEMWNINACGKTVQVPITFYIKRNGTVYVIEKMP